MNIPQNGDVIRVSRWNGLYAHYGIYVDTSDSGHVIHYTDEDKHNDFKGKKLLHVQEVR